MKSREIFRAQARARSAYIIDFSLPRSLAAYDFAKTLRRGSRVARLEIYLSRSLSRGFSVGIKRENKRGTGIFREGRRTSFIATRIYSPRKFVFPRILEAFFRVKGGGKRFFFAFWRVHWVRSPRIGTLFLKMYNFDWNDKMLCGD